MPEDAEVCFEEEDPRLNVDNTFVLTNLPTFVPEKESKFMQLLQRHCTPKIAYSKFPYAPNGQSKGLIHNIFPYCHFSLSYHAHFSFAFLTFANPGLVADAMKELTAGKIAGRQYVAYLLSDFLEIQGFSETYTPPEVHPFIETVSFIYLHPKTHIVPFLSFFKPNLYAWMIEATATSQYSYYHKGGLVIESFDSIHKAQEQFHLVSLSLFSKLFRSYFFSLRSNLPVSISGPHPERSCQSSTPIV